MFFSHHSEISDSYFWKFPYGIFIKMKTVVSCYMKCLCHLGTATRLLPVVLCFIYQEEPKHRNKMQLDSFIRVFTLEAHDEKAQFN